MEARRSCVWVCLGVALFALFGAVTVQAGTNLYWVGVNNGTTLGGAGTWSTASNNWSQSSNATGNVGPWQVWSNNANDTAVFNGGSTYQVTISGTVNVFQVSEAQSGTTPTLSGGTINLVGPGAGFIYTAGASVGLATTLAGTNGLTQVATDLNGVNYNNGGAYNLSVAATYSGNTSLRGTWQLAAANALPATTIVTLGGTGTNTSSSSPSGYIQMRGNDQQFAGLESAAASGAISSRTGTAGKTLTLSRGSGTSTFGGAFLNSRPATAPDGNDMLFNVVKDGNYTQVVGGGSADTYPSTNPGTNLVKAGVLALNKAAGTDAMGTGPYVVSGGQLRLDASNQINNAVSMTLTGGTFNINGFSESFSNLTVAAASTLDFGTGGANILSLSNVVWSAGQLTVTNWTYGKHLRVVNAPSAGSLAHIAFVGFASHATVVAFGGYYEVLPPPTGTLILFH